MENFYKIIAQKKDLDCKDIAEINSIYDHYPWFGLCRLFILKYKHQNKTDDFSKYLTFTILSVDDQNIDAWIEDEPQIMIDNEFKKILFKS